MIKTVFFKLDHVLNLGNLIKQPMIYLGIFHNKHKCLIDTGASISIISENCVPRSYHIEKFNNNIRDLSGQLNILGQIVTEIEIGEIKTIERFVVISKEHKIPGNVILGSDFLSKWNAHMDYSRNKLSGVINEVSWSINICNKFELINSINNIEILGQNSKIVECKTAAEDGCYLLNNESNGNFCILNGLVQVKSNRVFIPIINSLDRPIKIKDNELLANMHMHDAEIYTIETNMNLNESKQNTNFVLTDIPGLHGKIGQEKILQLINAYRPIMSSEGESLGRTDLIKAYINTGQISPIYTKQYPISHKEKSIVNEITDDMLNKHVIRESISPWNSPLILIKKKYGSFRPCIDFRKLNDVTVPEKFPIPMISDILQSMHGAKYFSTLDLESSYWQTAIVENDKQKTAFTTQSGHFEFNVMPFGLKNAPAIFSRLMSNVLAGLIGPSVLVYLDDIIIFSETLDEHLDKLKNVFDRLLKYNLKLKLKKCQFLCDSIKFLGHEISNQGVSVHKDHFDPIKYLKTPTTKKEVKKFMGTVSYFRAFVKDFAELAEPITKLLRNNVKFLWGENQIGAFEKLKNRIVCAKPLAFPNFNQNFILQTDASNLAIGAVLMQELNGQLTPIYCVSSMLTACEQKYATTKREGLAIIFALKKLRHIIYGYDITVYSDHKPLEFLFRKTVPDGQLGRWAILAQEYKLNIKYLPGKLNLIADSLSRIEGMCIQSNHAEQDESKIDYLANVIENDCQVNVIENDDWSRHELSVEQDKDQHLYLIKSIIKGEKAVQKIVSKLDIENYLIQDDLLLYRKNILRQGIKQAVLTICIPEHLEEAIIKKVHESPYNGHMAAEKTLQKFNWQFHIKKGTSTKVKKVTRNCQSCILYCGKKEPPVPLGKYPIPSRPFETVAFDFLGPFRATEEGNKYILVFTDYLTRYSVMFALPNKTTENVTKMMRKLIKTYDCPNTMISDNAQEFTSEAIKKLCASHGIRKLEVAPYHPNSNGLVKRVNSKILKILKIYCGEHNTDNWDVFLDDCMAAINATVNKTIGETPFYALYKYDKRDMYEGQDIIEERKFYNYDDYFQISENNAKIVYNYIRNRLEENIEIYTRSANKEGRKARQLEVGQRVFVKYVAKPTEQKKLAKKWIGPCIVLDRISPSKYKIQMNTSQKIQIVHIDNVITRRQIQPDEENKKIEDNNSIKTRSKTKSNKE